MKNCCFFKLLKSCKCHLKNEASIGREQLDGGQNYPEILFTRYKKMSSLFFYQKSSHFLTSSYSVFSDTLSNDKFDTNQKKRDLKSQKTVFSETDCNTLTKPKHFGFLTNASYILLEKNEKCNETIVMYFFLNGTIFEDATFETEGCPIVQASASTMIDIIKKKELWFVEKAVEQYFKAIQTGNGKGTFEIFGVFKKYSHRQDCASLPWKGLKKVIALEKTQR